MKIHFKDDLVLSIGDIRDICIEMPISDFINLQNHVFRTNSVMSYKFIGCDHEQKPRPTFVKRIIALSSGHLAFSENWINSAII